MSTTRKKELRLENVMNSRKYYSIPENAEKRRQYNREYYKKNKEKERKRQNWNSRIKSLDKKYSKSLFIRRLMMRQND